MDKITKLLLTTIALFMGIMLVRSAPVPALGQTAPPVPPVHLQSQLAVSGSDVYILQDDTLYVYEWRTKIDEELSPLNKPAKFDLILKRPISVHP